MKYQKLYDIVSKSVDLDERDKELVETIFECGTVEKGAYLIPSRPSGERCFFVLSGYLRYFKPLDSGDDLGIFIFGPGEFANSLTGCFSGTSSLQAITDVEVLAISRDSLERLYHTDPKWEAFTRQVIEAQMTDIEQCIVDLLTLTAKERYVKLLARHPDIIQNVPVKDIASSIGVHPDALSRIRKMIF